MHRGFCCCSLLAASCVPQYSHGLLALENIKDHMLWPAVLVTLWGSSGASGATRAIGLPSYVPNCTSGSPKTYRGGYGKAPSFLTALCQALCQLL